MEFVHQQLLELRRSGIGILLVSSELNELLSLSDRIAVVYEGQILDILTGEAADRERVGLLMAGVRAQDGTFLQTEQAEVPPAAHRKEPSS
jgi:simple sugar transport system ATP-binding protein